MSQSPLEAFRFERYEDGWEAINRMIREDLSWSGRERGCVHLNSESGVFADISAASGLDFIEDGRAFSVLDLDRDGRPDLALRNRNAPQLRLLRNRWPGARPVLWLALEGRRSNRDAIGARVSVRTSAGRRVKEVSAGSTYLSQSSRRLYFALGNAGVIDVEVRWPGGETQDLGALAPGRLWRVVEGRSPRAEGLRSPGALAPRKGDDREAPAARSPADPPEPRSGASEPLATWLLEPLPAPALDLHDERGGARDLESYRGRPLVLHLVSARCDVCREELPALAASVPKIEAAGARVLIVSVDAGLPAAEVFRLLRELAPGGRLFRTTETSLEKWNIAGRYLFNRRRDLVVPTTFLLDREGYIQKVYRGAVSSPTILSDASRLPVRDEERLALALPFEGRLVRGLRGRDHLPLGNAYFEAGLLEEAREVFARALSRGHGDLDIFFNYAVASAGSGDVAEAERIYREILDRRPDFEDARNNLGVLEARSGKLEAARAHFRRVLERNPGYARATLNLAGTYLQEGRLEKAARIYREGIDRDAQSTLLLRALANVRVHEGRLDEAIRLYRRALDIDPLDTETMVRLAVATMESGAFEEARRIARRGLEVEPRDPELLNALGVALHRLGRTDEAVSELRRAIAEAPALDRTYINLARVHLESGNEDRAREVARELLRRVPDHPVAREILENEEQTRGR